MKNALRTILLIAACMALAAMYIMFRGKTPTPEAPPANEKLPDIILITVDTLRADYVHSTGGIPEITPNIDLFAKLGTAFTACITAAPSTGPSLSSIHTGLYPYDTKVLFNAHSLPDDSATIARSLKMKGYDTAAFVSTSILNKRYNFNLGFDFYSDVTTKNYSMDDSERSAGELNDELISWLHSRESDRPLFLWIHYFDPHVPYTGHRGNDAGRSFSQEYLYALYTEQDVESAKKNYSEINRFYIQEIRYVDEEIGRLTNELTTLNYLDNAAIIFTADQGEELFAHENFYGHTRSLYNSVINVPLIVVLPDRAHGETVLNTTVRTIDIFPTIMEIAGIRTSGVLPGSSLIPVINGDDREHRTAFTMREPVISFWEGRGFALTSFPWKYIWFEESDNRLYNLENDRREQVNLFGARPEETDRLDKEIMKHISATPNRNKALNNAEMEMLKEPAYIQ